MSSAGNNIFGSQSTADAIEALIDVNKQLLDVNLCILEETKLANEYFKQITNLELTKEDICQT